MAVGKKLLSAFFSFTLVMGLLPYSAFADPLDSSSDSTESSSDASTSNESEFADGGVASKPDPSDSRGGIDSNGSVSGAEDAEFGVDDEFADEQELSAPDYSNGKLAIWADGLDDPSDIADVYPPDTNEIEAYASGSNLQPMTFSSEMLYFCKYESSCNYDQGLSSGDGYHAMGYFQFDNRYGLGSFLKAVYNYNPSTYSALKVIGDRYGWNVTGATRSNGAFTQLGNDLNAAWHAAYKANPTEFSNLQNGWAYIDSYNGSLGARGCLKAFGINLDNRPDCIKGLCWGMVNLFGAGGGASYINNGNYYGANWFFKNSGINDSMSDEAFVTTLCDYVVNNVAKRYPKQSIYWTGWQNRYKSEKTDCLRYIQSNIYPVEDNFASINKAPNSVSDGQYLLKTELGGMGVLQVGSDGSASETSLKICSSTMGEEQKFAIERDSSSGYVRIKNMQSFRYLGLVGSNGRYSQAVVQKEYSVDDRTLLWQIAESGGALIVKPAVNTGYCLDVTGGSFYEGVSVCLYKVNGTAAQRFSLISTSPKVEGGRTVADGVYSLASKADPSKVLDVAGGSVSNGGNVQAWAANGTAAQRFRLTCGDDGFYTIQNLKSGKVLDVADANLVPGTNVQQWDANGTDAQKWAVRANADGSYTIVSKANGLALDLSGSTVADGSNAQCWQLDGSGSQSFVLDGSKHERTVADGVYVVSSGLGGRKVLDMTGGSTANGARLQIWDSNMTEAQAFRFTYDDETGLYSIVSVKSGKALDATDGKCSNGTAVQQWGSNGTMAQRWAVLRDSGGLSIRSALDESQALDVANASASNGAKLQLYASNGTAAQLFSLVSVEHEKVEPCADLHLDGWYEIAPTSNGGLRFDVADGSRSNGAKIQLYSSNSTLAQLFRFEYKDGCYRIISANSGKAIEMQNGSIVPGVPVVQESVGNDDAQKFSVVKGEDGSYTFKCVANSLSLDLNSVASGEKVVGNTSSSSFNLVEKSDLLAEGIYSFATALNEGKVLDVADGSTSDGANVQLYSSNGTFAQKWKVSKAEHAGNTYRFESIKSGKYLAVNGNNVCQKAYDENSEYQLWTPASIEAGAYILKNVGTGTVLDVSNASTTDGANIQVYSSNGSNAQRFFLKKADPVRGVTYALHSSLNYGQVIDVADGSSSDGANIQSWASNDTGAQKWNVYQNGDGTYRVINAANGKALDVKDGKAFAGANIQQYSWNGTAAQKWIIEYQGEGAFSLASMANRNLVIEVSGGSAVNGSNIQLGAKDGSAKQKFSFEETTYVPPMPSDKQVMLNRITGTSSGTQWLIAVDRSTHKVGVFRGSAGNWSMWYYWSCVTGAPATPTITGTYRTTGFKRDALSTDSRAIYCTQIWQGYFFHSILASESELGQSLSHGCIRMAYSSAKWIHDNIYAGTTVVIYN